MQEGLKILGLFPLKRSLRQSLEQKLSLKYGPYVLEKENWYGQIFLTFRKGRLHIPELKLFLQQDVLRGKKYFISLSFGRKALHKIFSEYRLSRRQRQYVLLELHPQRNYEILRIDMRHLGLGVITSLCPQETDVDQKRR